MLMSSSFSARSAESLDSTPPQSASRTSRHRSNLSVNPVGKPTTTSVTIPSTLDFDKSTPTNTYSTEHHHSNHKENSSSMSTDIAHNNNKTIKDNDVGELEKELQRKSLKGISPTPQQNHPMSPVQNSLDHNQHEPHLKASEASRTSEMPDLSEQPSTFTRSAASTATLMAESTKERTHPSHNASTKLDDQIRKMLPLKQRMALSEDGSLDDKVSEGDQDSPMEARSKTNDTSINEKPRNPSLESNEKNNTTNVNASSLTDCPSDEKSDETKNQEHQLELLKQKSEEASKTIERLKMQLQQQSDYELLKREVLLLKHAPTPLESLASAGLKPMTSPSGPVSNSPSPVLPVQLSGQQSSPVNQSHISSLAGVMPSSSLEMLLLERAKILQQQNPVAKAFAELQGSSSFPGFPGAGVRHPLFPGVPPSGILQTPGAGMEAALGMMNEEMMAQWRKSLEQSSTILQQPLSASVSPSSRRGTGSDGSNIPGLPPLTPPSFANPGSNTRLSTHSPSSVTGSLPILPVTSSSPIPVIENTVESRKRSRSQSPGDSNIHTKTDDHARPPSSTSGIITTNGGDGSKTQSEDGTTSPPMRLDSKSPMKPPSDSEHLSRSPSLPIPTTHFPTFSTHAMHPHFPSHNPAISLPLPLPLSIPPLMSTGRIPKSDPMEGRLQDMLRYNMEKYAGQALDTLGMSRRVRELLSVHNIGQRLFAKYVLGLSQGTVSELLSKPKCWEKLTEKGRDSYRKMHAWAYDENAVMLLKSLIPRKGELVRSASTAALLAREDRGPPIPTFGQNGDERIAKILNEATKGFNAHGLSPLGPHKDVTNSNIASSLALPISQIPPTLPSNLSQSPTSSPGGGIGSSEDNSNLNPQERMSKLYQEELARIMRHRGLPPLPLPPGLPLPPSSASFDSMKIGDTITTNSNLPPGLPPGLNPFLPGLAGGLFGQKGLGTSPTHPSELQRAMDIYHQEFSRLQQRALADALRQNGGTPKDFMEGSGGSGAGSPGEKSDDLSTRDSNIEKTPEKDAINNQYSPIHQQDPPLGKSPGSTLFPSTGPPPGSAEDIASSLSPLQRMASITNSLVTQPPLSGGNHGNRPMRAILPPITQQQFDQFSHLNTDETVRRIKEILSQYSISQRLFGESVLGLSQGSVSDLLARPKPWHMLTQKGREPFIRMKLFLDDENAVHKLVASQYKIAPEKLMRTGEYSGALFPPPKQMPKMPDFSRCGLLEPPMLPSSLRFGLNPLGPGGIPCSTSSIQDSLLDRSPPILDPLALHRKLLSQQKAIGGGPGAPNCQGLTSSGLSNMLGGSIPPSPSLYEMAALTNELDTQTVTTKVKEILLSNNVGQKLFGEAVLGLSQGSVSELLSKPKPWHMLSIKGREPFIRMQLWLNDPQNIEKLQMLKNERRESASGPGKRKRLQGGSGVDSNSDRSSPADPSDIYASSADSPGSVSAAKKQRVLFSDEQKEALKIAFALDPYPSTAAMDYLSQELNLESRSISNWFHNHRMRLKQQLPPGMDRINPLLNKNISNSNGGGEQQNSFDPIKFKLIFHQRLLEMQQGQHTGSDDGVSVGNGSGVSMSALMMRQFGYAPLMGLGGDLSSLDSMLARTAGLGSGIGEEGISPGSGLDLSYKPRSQSDDDKDSIAADSPPPLDEARSDNEDSNADSVGDSTAIERQRAAQVALVASAALQQAVQAAGGRSSRRKPVAPQWVRPEWMEDKKDSDNGKPENMDECKESDVNSGVGEKENSLTINGVCVMNSYAFDNKKSEDDEDNNIIVHANDELDNDTPSDALTSDKIKLQRSPSVSPPIALNSNSSNAISVTDTAEGNS